MSTAEICRWPSLTSTRVQLSGSIRLQSQAEPSPGIGRKAQLQALFSCPPTGHQPGRRAGADGRGLPSAATHQVYLPRSTTDVAPRLVDPHVHLLRAQTSCSACPNFWVSQSQRGSNRLQVKSFPPGRAHGSPPSPTQTVHTRTPPQCHGQRGRLPPVWPVQSTWF